MTIFFVGGGGRHNPHLLKSITYFIMRLTS